LLLILIYFWLLVGLAAAEPFLVPTMFDLWRFVGLPAVVGWIHCQMAFGFAYIIARLGVGGAAYVIVVLWSVVMAYLVLQIPSEYAVDLMKHNLLLRELLKCKTQG
jgi:hypothetical protein